MKRNQVEGSSSSPRIGEVEVDAALQKKKKLGSLSPIARRGEEVPEALATQEVEEP